MGADAGLRVAAYGSYYRVGHPETGPFEAVLASAVALGAPHIRVWPGQPGQRQRGRGLLSERSLRTAAASATWPRPNGSASSTNSTPTRSPTRTRRPYVCLQTVDHANVRSLWQPPRYAAPADNLAGVEALRPWLEYLHVFHWHLQTGERRPLAEGEDLWRDYLAQAGHPDRTRCALLEFVQDDAPEAFLRDAATLLRWLGNYPDASH